MNIDPAVWKRVTTRIELLEDALDNMNDWHQGVYACLRMLSRRNGSTCGTDPMGVLMIGPGSRPRVLPDGITSEDIPGFYKMALGLLAGETLAEFTRRQSILWELRQMREERLARKAKLSPPPNKYPSNGGMSGF